MDGWFIGLVLLIVMFWNFDDAPYDLYDCLSGAPACQQTPPENTP